MISINHAENLITLQCFNSITSVWIGFA